MENWFLLIVCTFLSSIFHFPSDDGLKPIRKVFYPPKTMSCKLVTFRFKYQSFAPLNLIPNSHLSFTYTSSPITDHQFRPTQFVTEPTDPLRLLWLFRILHTGITCKFRIVLACTDLIVQIKQRFMGGLFAARNFQLVH